MLTFAGDHFVALVIAGMAMFCLGLLWVSVADSWFASERD